MADRVLMQLRSPAARAPVRARKTSSRSGVWTDSSSTTRDASSSRSSSGAQRARRCRRSGTCSVRRAVVAGRRRRSSARGRLELGRRRRIAADVPAGDPSLELGRRALGDEPAVVEHGDPVGQLVGLLEVLRGEEDRDAVGRPARGRSATWSGGCAGPARWSARPGRSPAARPTSVMARSSRRRIPPEYVDAGLPRVGDQVELLEQLGDPAPGRRPGRGGAGRPSA